MPGGRAPVTGNRSAGLGLRFGLRCGLALLAGMGDLMGNHLERKAEPSAGNPPRLAWTECAALPDAFGFKGAYMGVSGPMVLLAGGSNFPVPLRSGGKKAFSNRIYVRPVAAGDEVPWTLSSEILPEGLAEGAAVTTEHGVVMIGGQTAAGPTDEVVLLRWQGSTGSVERIELPRLPRACSSAAVAYSDGKLYVAGGERGGRGTGDFQVLTLIDALSDHAGAAWRVLPGWPGPPRFSSVLMPMQTKEGLRLVLCGGRSKATGPAIRADYLTDVYWYRPETESWSAAAAMPHPAQMAAALRAGPSRLLVLGGSDGHDLERIAELGERYRIPDRVQLYDAIDDRWSVVGSMPLGVAGAAIAEADGSWLIAGGEYSPGLRTPRTFRLAVAPAAGNAAAP